MKVLIAGASGYIGRALTGRLLELGHQVTGLSRDPQRAAKRLPDGVQVHPWDPLSTVDLRVFDGVDVVITVMGEPALGWWTAQKKRRMYESRVNATKALVSGMAQCSPGPKVFISGSAVGFYGNRQNELLDEASGPGDDFLSRLTSDWESEALEASSNGMRVVTVRTGLVVGRGSPFIRTQTPLYRMGLGARLGNGNQWWPWVHLDDVVGVFLHALTQQDLEGPLNATSPKPIQQKDFSAALGAVLSRPTVLRVPKVAIRLLLGEMSTEILTSKRVLPNRVIDDGYEFCYPEINLALRCALHSKSTPNA